MRLKLNSLTGVLALVVSTSVAAQGQPAAKKPAPNVAPAVQAQPGQDQRTTTTPPTATTTDELAPQSAAPGQTGATPGQAQTSPGEASQLTPAQTGETPSGQATAQGQAEQPTAATAADVKAGVSVYDQKGGLVGKVESVSGKGAVVSTGTVKASIPVSSFAKGEKGLVISMSKAEIDAAAKETTAKTTKTAKKPK